MTEVAASNKVPAIYHVPEFVTDGGLMSYGVNIDDLFQRAPVFVDKILKGANPADLPIELPVKFSLVVNAAAGKRIGYTFPESILFRADRVIR